jgi:hypothetical protein
LCLEIEPFGENGDDSGGRFYHFKYVGEHPAPAKNLDKTMRWGLILRRTFRFPEA